MAKKLKLLYFFLLIGAVAAVATCTRMTSIGEPTSAITGLTRSVDHAYLSGQAYMGGSVLYYPENPVRGHLEKGAVVAVRLSAVQKKPLNGNELTFTDDGAAEVFGALTVQAIDAARIQFSFALFNADHTKTERTYTLAVGESADLNGDGANDVQYRVPEQKHAGFESAVYLTFLSSQEALTTSMFAVLPDQYSGAGYPSGIIGINPDGKFLYAKYESDLQTRSVVYGLESDDFVLDNSNGSYVKAVSGRNSGTARAISDDELETSTPLDITDVLPLASWTAGPRNRNGMPVAAETYEDYLAKKDEIYKLFSSYRRLIEIPVQQVLDDINAYQQIKLDASVGLNGRFVVTWSQLESDLMSGVYFAGEVDVRVDKDVKSQLVKVGPYEFFKEGYTFAIGPIPVKVSCPASFEMPIDLKLTGNPDASFKIAVAGLYGGGVDAGVSVHWDKAFRKGFMEPFAKAYPLTEGVVYVGARKVAPGEARDALSLMLAATPAIAAMPRIDIGSTVWTGFEGAYRLPAEVGIALKEDGQLNGTVRFSHEGSLSWFAGITLGGFKKEFKPTLVKIGPKEIKTWTIPLNGIFQ